LVTHIQMPANGNATCTLFVDPQAGDAAPAASINQAVKNDMPLDQLSDIALIAGTGWRFDELRVGSSYREVASQFNIVNVIPNQFSQETNQNSEPNIGINPRLPAKIVISAFGKLPNRPITDNGSILTNSNPYFTTANGGQTWFNSVR